MKLYASFGACSLSPHIVLREAGIPFTLQKVDLGAHQLDGGGDYYQVNAKGYVPALELDNGERLTEGPAIVQYLADLKPASGLAPANGTFERVRLQEWLNFISSEVHKQFSPLFNQKLPAETRQMQIEKLGQRFDWLAKQLSGKTYLTSEHFSVADAYLFTVLNWSQWVGIDLAKWPVLKEYVARVAARPKVQEALKAEGLAK